MEGVGDRDGSGCCVALCLSGHARYACYQSQYIPAHSPGHLR